MSNSILQVVGGGIQEISAILPLLGTEQCEEHIGSALIGGFCYVGVTPISIFGSWELSRQASMFYYLALLSHPSTFSERKDWLMEDPERFAAESQLEKLLEDEHIENLEDLNVVWNEDTIKWNFRMIPARGRWWYTPTWNQSQF
ncbi:hypothetical protein BDQ17DRAFT_1328281 [Cyathus striatus]|nr:hypothetical protein BDQ17DRAFT_1328281 [Cyathus striatus]